MKLNVKKKKGENTNRNKNGEEKKVTRMENGKQKIG